MATWLANWDRLPGSLLCNDGMTRFNVMYVSSHSPVALVIDNPVRIWCVVSRFDVARSPFIRDVICEPDRLIGHILHFGFLR